MRNNLYNEDGNVERYTLEQNDEDGSGVAE